MRTHTAWRTSLVVAVALVAALVASLLGGGCGQPNASTSTAVPDSASGITVSSGPSTSRLSSPPSSDSVTTVQPQDFDGLFTELAAACQPTTIFAPTDLPEGAVLADRWFPVLESQDPGSYDGPPAGNPQVVGSGGDSEVQVIFQSGDGWLAILENFRGDLGDVTGTPVGWVAGNEAAVYTVDGGELVQWSKDGRWYGVFGRGIARDQIVEVALGMQPVSAEAR